MAFERRGHVPQQPEPPQAPSAIPATEATKNGDGIKVLIVSDLLMTRQALRHVLEGNGCSVVGEVTRSDEALQAAAASPPDIFLVDLDSVAELLKCLDELASVYPGRTMALSNPGSAEHQTKLVEYGAAGVVFKNEPPHVLIKAITKVHAGEAWLARANTARLLTHMVLRRREEQAHAERIARLTAREREIIALVGEGMKNGAIAERLFISVATVRNHLTSILAKLGVSDRFELAVYAFRHRLVEYPETPPPAKP